MRFAPAKTRAQRTARPAARSTSHPGRRAPSVANHVAIAQAAMHDLWERQADLAAARVLAGERGVAASLWRAPAASASVPGSPGDSLPAELRAGLERGFGADLSAVRVHTDGSAAAAAHALGARAFTAGRDIYFGRGWRDLASERGRLLLAHEVAHALQQAGRRGPDGRWRVEPRAGDAPAQRKPDPTVDEADDAGWLTAPFSYAKVRSIYETGFATDPETLAAFKAVDPLFATSGPGGFKPKHPSASALIALTKASGFPSLTDRTKSFYYDCLKGIEEYDAATTLLEANDRRLVAAWGSRAFYEHYRSSKHGWKIASVAFTDADLKKVYPSRFMETLRKFLYSPDVRNPGNTEYPHVLTSLHARIKGGRPYPNEAVILSFFGVRALIGYFPSMCERLFDRAKDELKGATNWQRKLEIARWILEKPYSDELFVEGASREVVTLLANLWKKIQSEATRAREYWERVRSFREAIRAGRGVESLTADAVAAKAKNATANPALVDLDDMIGGLAAPVLQKPLSPPDVFEGNIKGWYETVDAYTDGRALELVRLVGAGKEKTDEALQLGLAILDLREFYWVLKKYDRANDDRLTAEGYDDERQAARIRAAWRMDLLADRYTLPKTKAAAKKVLDDKWQLALNGVFEETSVSLGDLSKELVGIEGVSQAGISLWDYEHFLWSKHYEFLAEQLELILAARERDFTPFSATNKPILTEATEIARTMGKPRRFLMKDFQYVHVQPTKKVTEKGVVKEIPDPAKRFSELLKVHPRYVDFTYQKHRELPGYSSFIPLGLLRAGIVVWFIPHIEDFVALLKGIPGLNEKVMERWTVLYGGKGKAKRDPSTATAWEWLRSLGNLADELRSKGKKGEEEAGQLGKDLRRTIEERYQAQKKATAALLRRATSHDRIVYARHVIVPALAQYDRYELRTWDRITEALRLFGKFADSVQPAEDKELQIAALVFDVVDELDVAIGNRSSFLGDTGPVRRHDVLGLATPLVEGALDLYLKRSADMAEVEKTQPGIDLSTRAVKLMFLASGLRERIAAVQSDRGLTADPAEMSLKVGFWSYKVKPSGTGAAASPSFAIYLKRYTILQINEKFTYLPAFTALDEQGVKWPTPLTGQPRLLGADGKTDRPRNSDTLMIVEVVDVDKTGAPLPDAVPDLWVIKADDDEKLTFLAAKLSDWAAFEHLRNVGLFIEAIATIYLELAELIPGIGNAIAAGRLIATILDLILSGEFESAVEAFGENGLKRFKEFFQDLETKLDPTWLVKWFLFGDAKAIHSNVKPKEHAPNDKQKEVMGRGGAWARIIRALKNVIEIGKRILGAFVRVKKRVEGPFRRAQIWVLSHRGASLVLGLLDQYWDTIAAFTMDILVTGEDEADQPGVGAEVKKGAQGGVQGVVDQIAEAANFLNTFELPEEIISVAALLDFAIDFAIGRLGLKYRKPIQAIRAVLEKLGAWKRIMKYAEDFITKHVGDPNDLWKGPVKTHLQGKLDAVRKDLLGDVFAKLSEIPFLKGLLTKPDSKPVEIKFGGTDFPTTEGYASDRARAPAMRGAIPSPSGGDPLPRSARASAELSFGHDFSHVRVHTGGDADRLTSAFRAEALTTGSHVYLRPGLSPSSGFGARVMRHELAHVIQQTGSRPLGDTHDSRPVAGEPGRGFQYDPAHEAAADRAASIAESTARRPGDPVDVGGRARGAQPGIFAGAVVRDILRELRNFESIEKTEKTIDAERKLISPSRFHTDPLNKVLAERLPDKLYALLKGMPDKNIDPPFHLIRGDINALIDATWKETMPGAIYAVIAYARTEKSPKRSAQLEGTLYWYMPPDAFETRLREYLFAKTGLAFGFHFPRKKGPPEVREAEIIDIDGPEKEWSASILNVHLPLLEAKAGMATAAMKIWKDAVSNTFSGTTGYDEAKYIEVARLVLARRGPRPETWEKTAFKFGKSTAKQIADQVKRIDEVLAGGVWPTPEQYKETDASKVKGANASAVKNVGLRLGNYKTWGPGAGGAKDRDAHHTTQFLLLEYFRNTKFFKPFKTLGATSKVPGVTATLSGEVDEIAGSSAGDRIDVKKFVSGSRGALMPTIYIARHTHQSGIHFHAEKPDEESPASQAAAVHLTFMAAMSPHDGVLASPGVLGKLDKAATDSTPVPLASGGSVTRSDIKAKIFSAAVKTYQTMRDEMFNKLEYGLKHREVEYYNAVAKIHKGGKDLAPTEKLDPGEMPRVKNLAYTNNEILEQSASSGGAGFKP